MTSRERIRAIIAGETADRCGFWMGNPHPDTWPLYHAHFGTATEEELRLKLGDDFRWICPQFYASTYRHPKGLGMFDAGLNKECHGLAGPFADCEDIAEVEAYEWPNVDYLNFDDCIADLHNTGEFYRASGFWTCFYHNIMDLFGMESYMLKMLDNPDVVHAVTDKVCQFYYEANERFYAQAGDLMDGFFFGNDFGTQVDLICGPEQFDEYIMPWFRRFTDQAHQHGYQVILHSCGAIHRVIDRLIDANVDCLHPLQARACNMDADTLARDYKGRIAFLGGVDTQDLLVNAAPDQIRAEVHRLKQTLGPNLIISPSHEALLPNVPPENVAAMAEAATE
ncbi:MAG TPA: uroporphyrinogen decarboxylase family protein [Candidatus Hydrogenedentes bacterium]|nr:uroporphyrinogen decarboxylase family protein [Candidatus Hydrogenedentota bacterium]HOS02124.1 uroporphyrinogen decarboxylase family protein [Candidatus Hydrogenedentota bacterium]